MADKQPTFHERIEALEVAAKQLDDIASLIIAEVERMSAAEKRFSERRADKRSRRSR
jgi:hypothetical protein